jgi:hypothetical protein
MSILSNASSIEDGLKAFLVSKGLKITQTFTISEEMFRGTHGGNLLAVAVEAPEKEGGLEIFWEMALNGEHEIYCKKKKTHYILPKEFYSKIV